MKRNKMFGAFIALLCALSSCSDRPDDLLFKDFFVYVMDETNSASSRVLSTANNLVVTYSFYLVSETLKEPLTVNFDVIIGDGLSEGTDFIFQTESRSVTFEPGVYKKPFRILYKNHAVDPTKDNTIQLVITSTSDPDIIIGYPGPKHKYDRHKIELYNLN